jgi:polysaccharide chain length determinant protein (PEP-CTERM system associated)
MDVMRNPESATDLSDLFDMAQDSSPSRTPRFEVRYFLNLLLRFRWVLIAPFCLAMLAGIILAATLPRMYQADATILVEPQSVPDRYVHATVPVDIESRIASLTQQILSRSNLTELIERFKLFSDTDSQSRFFKLFSGGDMQVQLIEDKLDMMRKRITVTIEGKRGGGGAGAFKISYKDSDGKKAFQVASAMTNYVIDQNLKMRESSAYGTSDFLQEELMKMRARLEEVEKALEEYRRANMGELPEQLQSNLTILERMQKQLGESHQRLREEKNRMLIVESQVRFGQQAANPSLGATLPGPDGGPNTLETLRQQLMEYETKYTGNHPDVVVLKKKIEAREKELAEGGKAPAPQTVKAAPAAAGGRPLMEADLRGQQQGILRNIQAIEAEIVSLQAQIEQYQKRVEDTPKREQEMLLLKRDYENIKTTYNSVLARKLESDIALNMEKKQKGEQFRILDPPRAAEKPVSPNLKLLFLACVMAGLGIGGGLVFLCEFFDNSVRKPEALQARLSLPVLMVMPAMEHMQTRRSRMLGWLNHGLSAAGALACLGLLACLAAVTIFNLSPSEVIRGVFH